MCASAPPHPHRTQPNHTEPHLLGLQRGTTRHQYGDRQRSRRLDTRAMPRDAPPGPLPEPLLARLERLTPDQRAAATAPPGPTLCVAPAGSGKTTTLIARIAWLIGSGVAQPASVTAVTFNKRAAIELEQRLGTANGELGDMNDGPSTVRVRTFHALAREILIDAGLAVEPLVDRIELLRSLRPDADGGELGRLDTTISRLKLDLGVTADDVAR